MISTATGVSEMDGVVWKPKKLARNQVPATADPECSVPAGIHMPSAGVIVQTRAPTTAVDAPRSFQSNSWKGWECSPQVVSCATISSYGWIPNGMTTAPAATTGSERVARVARVARGVADAPRAAAAASAPGVFKASGSVAADARWASAGQGVA